jgi:hypothetical protein
MYTALSNSPLVFVKTDLITGIQVSGLKVRVMFCIPVFYDTCYWDIKFKDTESLKKYIDETVKLSK